MWNWIIAALSFSTSDVLPMTQISLFSNNLADIYFPCPQIPLPLQPAQESAFHFIYYMHSYLVFIATYFDRIILHAYMYMPAQLMIE